MFHYLRFHGGVYDNKYAGNNWLLTKGAICINSETDLIENLTKIYPLQNLEIFSKKSHSIISITKEFKPIYSVLTKSPQHINLIAEKSHIPLNELQSKLFMMELDGIITKTSSNYYKK